jgi:glycosyltransferase involved in cell wall biosynthesis
MTRPLVTIGVPVYNGEDLVGGALDSLLTQDYENFEILIEDNCSTDGTTAICAEYARRDPRIKHHRRADHVGVFTNFKNVLDRATGSYFMWAAVDDRWYPRFVSEMVDELEAHPDAGVAMSAIDRIWENGDPLDTIRFVGDDDVNRKTNYELTKGFSTARKYNLFIYGLFRTPLAQGAMRHLPEVPTWDRLLMCQMALAMGFRYVDEVLHTRMAHYQPSHVRLPNERYNVIQTQEKWVEAKVLAAFAVMLARSEVIPWRRKPYAVPVLQRYAWYLYRGKVVSGIKDRLDASLWDRLKPIRRFFRAA